jgi:hypothetical protein
MHTELFLGGSKFHNSAHGWAQIFRDKTCILNPNNFAKKNSKRLKLQITRIGRYEKKKLITHHHQIFLPITSVRKGIKQKKNNKYQSRVNNTMDSINKAQKKKEILQRTNLNLSLNHPL